MDNFQCGEDYQVVDVIGTPFSSSSLPSTLTSALTLDLRQPR